MGACGPLVCHTRQVDKGAALISFIPRPPPAFTAGGSGRVSGARMETTKCPKCGSPYEPGLIRLLVYEKGETMEVCEACFAPEEDHVLENEEARIQAAQRWDPIEEADWP